MKTNLTKIKIVIMFNQTNKSDYGIRSLKEYLFL